MPSLTQDRNTQRRDGDVYSLAMSAATIIYAGAMVGVDTGNNGAAKPMSAVNTLICAGRALEQVDNLNGALGDKRVTVQAGCFKWANQGDITAAHLGQAAYCVDDQTVSSSDAVNTRPRAGTVIGVDSDGVWVRCGLGL